jgi:hypothetical protein
MSFFTVEQAEVAIRKLGFSITAAELRDIVSNTAATFEGSTPTTTLLYSGELGEGASKDKPHSRLFSKPRTRSVSREHDCLSAQFVEG